MTSWGQSTPPPRATAVFAVIGSSRIAAPADTVWEVIMDFPSYREWNPCIRGQKILDSSNSTTLSVGSRLSLDPVHLPPTMDDANVGFLQKNSIVAKATVLDHEHHRVAWRLDSALPRWMLDVERWQMLTEEDGMTKYESYEVFKGVLSYVYEWFVKRNLQLGVEAIAEGLKARVEAKQVPNWCAFLLTSSSALY